MQNITFLISPVHPFRLDLTVWALRRRPRNIMDLWDGTTYSRVIVLGTQAVLVNVSETGTGNAPTLKINVFGKRINPFTQAKITSVLDRLLGLRIDLNPFYRFASHDPQLHALTQRFKGLKPPRFSVFEVLVNGIACQQFSLEAGLTILNRLTVRTGLPFVNQNNSLYAFPRPEDIVEVPIQSLRTLGFSTSKAVAINAISQEIISGHFDPESLSECTNEEAVTRLQELRGIGRWTAEYVLLRGLGRMDVFPGDDVGARSSLARWLKVKGIMDYPRVEETLRRWGTYKGLIYFHLLLDGLERKDLLRVGEKAA